MRELCKAGYHHKNSIYSAVSNVRDNQLHELVLAEMDVHVCSGREVQAGELF